MSVTAKQLVDEARLAVPEIAAADTFEQIQRGQLGILIDVREPAEWNQGHAPDAVHIPRGLLEWMCDPTYANHEPRLANSTDKPVVVMCASGGRSLLAARTLREMGYRHVSSLAGGFVEWKEAGLPVEVDQ